MTFSISAADDLDTTKIIVAFVGIRKERRMDLPVRSLDSCMSTNHGIVSSGRIIEQWEYVVKVWSWYLEHGIVHLMLYFLWIWIQCGVICLEDYFRIGKSQQHHQLMIGGFDLKIRVGVLENTSFKGFSRVAS